MTTQELNERTIELLREKLASGSSLIICIAVNPKTGTFNQIVGYGVDLDLLRAAMDAAWYSLNKEIKDKQS